MSAESDVERLKEACAWLKGSDGSLGSGYLIAPQRVATAWHVVRNWGPDEWNEVTLGWDRHRATREARVIASDQAADAAILELRGESPNRPLPVRIDACEDDDWRSFGFPLAAKREGRVEGMPLRGSVRDPALADVNGVSRLALACEEAAAGNATSVQGWSGSPVLVDGGVVGHLVRFVPDTADKSRPAYGQLRACPADVVVRLLGTSHAPVLLKRRSEEDDPDNTPNFARLAAWCDREEVMRALTGHLRDPDAPRSAVLFLIGHRSNRHQVLIERVAEELQHEPDCLSPAVRHALKNLKGDDDMPGLQTLTRSALGARGDSEIRACLGKLGGDPVLLSLAFECGSWSRWRFIRLMRNARERLAQMDTGTLGVVLVVVLRFSTPPWFLRWRLPLTLNAAREAHRRVLAAGPVTQARRVALLPLVELRAATVDELTDWAGLDLTKETLGRLADELQAWFSSEKFGRRSLDYAGLVEELQRRHRAYPKEMT